MAPPEFRRGFKAEAERLVLELRSELGLDAFGRLDGLALAKHLSVPVVSIVDVLGLEPNAARHFTRGSGRSEFSAATIYLSRWKRCIVFNPAHSEGRQVNSLCHELSHILLGHEPEEPESGSHSRDWNSLQEREADWLAACLLIPAEAAKRAASRGWSDSQVASEFGVSAAVAAWRLNATGARRIARRSLAARGRWTRATRSP